MIKSVLKFFGWLLVSLIVYLERFIFLIFSLSLFFIITLFFGHGFLTSEDLLGNDIYNVFSHINWINRYFPKIPFWYPVEGTGTSLQYGYPILSHLITVFASRLFGLSIIESFRWLGFLSIFLTGAGIYFYGWLRLKSQIIGLMAGFFYLVSTIAYCWLFQFGFYAESIGLVFMPWAIICFEFFLEKLQKKQGKAFFWLFLSALLWGMAFFCHYVLGIGLLTYFFFLTINSFWKKRKLSRKRIKRGILAILIFGLAIFGLWSFRFIPSARFLMIADREGLETKHSFEQLDYSAPQLKTLFAMVAPILETEEFKDADYFWKEYHFVLPVILLFFLGSLVCLFIPNLRLFVIFSWWAFIIFSLPHLRYFLMKKLPFGLFFFFDIRTFFSVVRLMIPIVTGAGIWKLLTGVHELVVRIFTGKRKKSWSERLIKETMALPLLLGLLMFLFYFGRKLPEDPSWVLRYGWNSLGERGAFDLRDIWHKRNDDICPLSIEGKKELEEKLCQFPQVRSKFNVIELSTFCVQERDAQKELPDFCLAERIDQQTVDQLLEWCDKSPDSVYCQARFDSPAVQIAKFLPELKLNRQVNFLEEQERGFLKNLKEQEVNRYDVSPKLARFINGSTYYTDVSRFTFSTHQLSLNHSFWSYLQGLYYTDDPVNRTPGVVEELAKWFGIKKVFLNIDDPIENFDGNFWFKDDETSKLVSLKTKEALKLAVLSNRPTFLVIGDFKKGVLHDLFKLSNRGVLPYDDFWLVEGSKNVDDYSLNELKNFDGLILHGYGYKSRQRGWERLDQYIKEGGLVFLNAGWQYTVPDWEMEEAPKFLPVKQTKWTDYGKTGDFLVNENLLGKGVEEDKFADLVWDGKPWSVSGVKSNDLRDWAQIILSFKDNPLMVGGNYGKGKVIWSGVNLLAHALENKNEEEIKFLGTVFKWLAKDKEKKDVDLEILRSNPDKVEFIFHGDLKRGWLLWKEAYFTDWRAKIYQNGEVEKIKIYRGGPSLMIMPLKEIKEGDRLKLYYQEPVLFKFLKILAVMTFLVLFTLMFGCGRKFSRSAIARLSRLRPKSLNFNFFKSLKEKWGKEEDY
ncbi:MAG TPA: hypothetical protein VMW29_00420 [Candidatus Bathyarchaeia archaeon]|nr:hypothetical protein [Candidatus Bathyarchaeia archaeon]